MNDFVWKLCRVIANRSRLKIMQHLISEIELPVSGIALALGLTRPSASRHIRLLSEYGFIEATPSSKWLLCHIRKPMQESPMYDLQKTLLKQLRAGEIHIDKIYRSATAFTHERRIRIIQLLQDRSMPFNELIVAADISGIALHRHINKLIDRNLIKESDDIYSFTRPSDPILKSLLKLF